MFPFRQPSSPPPGPPRFFLYVEAALLFLLSLSLLSSYTKRYPLFNQTDSPLYQIQEETSGDLEKQEDSRTQTKEKNEPAKAGNKETEETKAAKTKEKKWIKWVDFTVTAEAMDKAFRLDLDTCLSEPHLNWIELLAYLGARYGGDFSRYKAADLDAFAQKLLNGESIEDLTKDLTYYPYYKEAYTAVLGGMVGVFREEIPADQAPKKESAADEQETAAEDQASQKTAPADEQETAAEAADEPSNQAPSEPQRDTVWVTKYGLKAFSPIAKGFPYSDFDDFGTARSYGFKRQHLGHDMMGQVGTPIFIRRYILFCIVFLL